MTSTGTATASAASRNEPERSAVRASTVDDITSPGEATSPSCTPGYEPCIPWGDDVDCAGGRGDGPRYVDGPVFVAHGSDDPYALDLDNDGAGCEINL